VSLDCKILCFLLPDIPPPPTIDFLVFDSRGCIKPVQLSVGWLVLEQGIEMFFFVETSQSNKTNTLRKPKKRRRKREREREREREKK